MEGRLNFPFLISLQFLSTLIDLLRPTNMTDFEVPQLWPRKFLFQTFADQFGLKKMQSCSLWINLAALKLLVLHCNCFIVTWHTKEITNGDWETEKDTPYSYTLKHILLWYKLKSQYAEYGINGHFKKKGWIFLNYLIILENPFIFD